MYTKIFDNTYSCAKSVIYNRIINTTVQSVLLPFLCINTDDSILKNLLRFKLFGTFGTHKTKSIHKRIKFICYNYLLAYI